MNNSHFSRRGFLVSAMLSTASLSHKMAAGAADTPTGSSGPARGCFICVTCGSQFAATDGPPHECPICLDERQYVGPNGQQWATLDEMRHG
jgi:rubrerythrin